MLGGLHYSYKLEVSFLSGAIRRSSFLLVKLEGVLFFLQTLCRSIKVKNKVGFTMFYVHMYFACHGFIFSDETMRSSFTDKNRGGCVY